MDPQAYDRWLEITFFHFCQDIIAKNNEIMDMMDLIDGLASIGKYNGTLLKQTVQELFSTYRIRPTQEEFTLLCLKAGFSIRKTQKLTRTGTDHLYDLIEQEKRDPRVFYPKLNSNQLLQIQKFFDTIEYIKKAGLQQ